MSLDPLTTTVQVIAGGGSVVRQGALISPTEDEVFTIVTAWLQSALDDTVPVVRGQENRVAEPSEEDWVEVTPTLRARLGTNATTFTDLALGLLVGPFPLGQRTVTQPTQVTIQVDVFGLNSAQNSTVISALFRDLDACDFFEGLNPAVSALYASDPRQLAYINEGRQYEDRWSIDLALQVNFAVTRPQEFAAKLAVSGGLYPIP